MGLIDVIYVC